MNIISIIENPLKISIIENPNLKHLVENAGFIRDGLETRTYLQTKKGLNYWYVKQKVLQDGVTTYYLDNKVFLVYLRSSKCTECNFQTNH